MPTPAVLSRKIQRTGDYSQRLAALEKSCGLLAKKVEAYIDARKLDAVNKRIAAIKKTK